MKKFLAIFAIMLVIAMTLSACNIEITPKPSESTSTTTPEEPKEDVIEIIDGYIWVNGVNTGIKANDGKEDENPDDEKPDDEKPGDEEPKEDVIEIIDGYIWVNGVNTGIKVEECDHIWETYTVPPTCTEGGYDIMMCALCEKSAIINKTEKLEHVYSTEYMADDEYHWLKCEGCDDVQGKEYHTLDEDGVCTTCSMPISETPGVIYDVSADGTYAEVIGYEGTSKRVKIASEYKGLPVRNIYEKAFYNNDLITHVVIPDSVTSIGDNAFDNCSALKSVVMGDGVTSIGNYAFSNCSALKSLEIPDSVTSIGSGAFASCSKLYIEYEGVKYVGSKDNPYFALIEVNNKNLSSYTIHGDTKIIANYAFLSCARLVSVNIPDGVTHIGAYAFSDCSALESVVIGDSVTSIGNDAFKACYALESVVIGDSVTSIGGFAFSNCSALESVVIGDSVTSIGDHAFYLCSALESVVIGDGVTSIGGFAFYGCAALESVVIGDGVTRIGDCAFYDCAALKDVYYKGNEEDWAKIEIGTTNYNLTGATRHYNYVPEE